MKKYAIESSMLTGLFMCRRNLITKEKAKAASEGKLESEGQKVSINDDLEMFLKKILNSKEMMMMMWELSGAPLVGSFCTPKLTKEELKLVEVRNKDHMETYSVHLDGSNPDVEPEEMKKSDSKAKFVHVVCYRNSNSLRIDKNKT